MNNKLSLLAVGAALVAGALLYHTREYTPPTTKYLVCNEKIVFIGKHMTLHEDGRATAWSGGKEMTYIPETHKCYIKDKAYEPVKPVQ